MYSIFTDIAAAAFCCGVCRLVLQLLKKSYAKRLIDRHLLRKLYHICVGLIVMLCWPMFSSSLWGRVLAGLTSGLGFFEQLIAIGMGKDEKLLKFLKRYKDSRDLLKAILAYVLTIILVAVFDWRTPRAIAIICNLCAGDGMADIVGRRFGGWKLPYNKNKSYAGTIGMAIAGFFTSILFMYYFSWLGYIEESPNMVLGFLAVSIAAALVESHPLSTKIEDNVTVPLASMVVGTFVL
ncbi:hypothetical protein DH2020_031168 [Rehmannia glutinosa]|uniref:Phytol kinase n=1 Tax=Rehmannia glutinosa TaxID=99300 RepID=A0ABR0VL59_REHGL